MSEHGFVEVVGATIDEAIASGLAQLDVSAEDVKIEVIDEGSLGILGIGKRDAIVRVIRLDEVVVPQTESVVVATPVAEPIAPSQNGGAEAVAAEPTTKVEADSDLADVQSEEIESDEPSLAEEAEAVDEIMTTLLELMGVEAEVDVTIDDPDDLGNQVPVVRIIGDDLSQLVGQRGAILTDIQFLTRSMVSQKLHSRTRFVIDINGYRDKRIATLSDLAKRTAEKAIKYHRPISLNPMPASERRIIHMTLRNDERVITKSKGEGERRRVRIIPKRA